MIHLIRSEWVKFRSVRSTIVLLVAGAVLTVLVAGLQANSIAGDVDSVLRPAEVSQHLGDLTVGVTLAVFLFGALGVQIIGQEYRFNTIRLTFAATPIRWRVLVAKLLTVCACVAVISAVMLALCAAVGAVMLPDMQIDGVDQRVVFGTMLFSMGWAAMGLGVGAILRQPIAGILVMLGVPFVVENLLYGLFPATAPWLPFQNGVQMTVRDHGGGDGGEHLLRSVAAGGLYFFAVAVAVLIIGLVLADRRDA